VKGTLQRLWLVTPHLGEDKLTWFKDVDEKSYKVRTSGAIAKGELRLVPYLADDQHLYVFKEPLSPDRVAIKFCFLRGDGEYSIWLTPDVSTSTSEKGEVCNKSRSLFWGIRRADADVNCELVTIMVQNVQCANWHGAAEFGDAQPSSQTFQLEVPILTNSEALPIGVELVLRPTQALAKKNPAKRGRTWLDEAKSNKEGSKATRPTTGS
jgi:hypothetical protein